MDHFVKHVLIIDDDEDDCDLFCDALKIVDANIVCEKVFSAKKALALLATSDYHPDFIFLDLNMHVMDGKKCLAELGAMEGVRHVPVIIYSTSKRESDIAYTKGLGAVHFITKPSSLTELCSEISFVLEKKWEQHDVV
jgi:DNA-binding response OmpR family regulator